MNRKEALTLIEKYTENKATAAERQLVEKYFLTYLKQNRPLPDAVTIATASKEIWASLQDHIPATRPAVSARRLWTGIVSAAAVFLVLLGAYFFHYQDKEVFDGTGLTGQDIDPGKVGATLTLANGKKIRLNDVANGELAREAGIRVSKTTDGQLVYEIESEGEGAGQLNTLSTEKGETYIVTLPDKSKVWLNAASSLTYPAGLNEHGLRRVRLEGEAYFQVAKDKAHPFVVQTSKQEVEVLGTEFNINSYGDEPVTATTLVEGSVKVRSGKLEQFIVPGEQVVNDGTEFKVAKVSLDNVVDWKKGEFNLDGLPFRMAMRKIARWYDIAVIYDASVPNDIIAGGWISRDTRLLTILEVIQRSKQVHFKLEGRKLYISK